MTTRGLLATGLATLAAAAFAQPAAAWSPSYCGWDLPTNEAFFTSASLGYTDAPGDIAACRQVQVLDDDLPAGTRIYQVIYRSQNSAGAPVPVSGTVLIPAGGGTGIVSLGTGTVGTADKVGSTASCAPSAGLPDGSAFVSGTAARYLGEGYAVAVTDYEGLRTPGQHPYLDGKSAGRAMINVARAAKNLPGEPQLDPLKTLFTGYSQGGHASVWAAQIAPAYAPDLPVAGAVAGGVPVSVEAVRANLDGALASGLLTYLIQGLNSAYPSLGLYGRLTSSGLNYVTTYSAQCSTVMALNPGSWFRSWNNLWKTGQNPLNEQAFVDALAAYSVQPAAPTVPVYFFHGDDDGIVPILPAQSRAYGWIAQGAPVEWHTVSGSHLYSSNANGQEASLGWIADRFAGLPL